MDAKEIVKAFREHPEWAQANEFQGSQCAILLAKLNEAERRERAAVEDMTEMANLSEDAELCEFCKWYGDDDCQHPTGGPHCFDWRGPQEAGNQKGADL